jgi:hypothetical protein
MQGGGNNTPKDHYALQSYTVFVEILWYGQSAEPGAFALHAGLWQQHAYRLRITSLRITAPSMR